MLSTRHLTLIACATALVLATLPGLATGAQGNGGGSRGLDLLERPAKRFERSIEAHLDRVAARRARRQAERERLRARRERRRARGAAAWDAGAQGVPGSTLGAIAACESGGDPGAVNPAGYYGKYQFDIATWQSVGGSGNPAQASEAEQDHRAGLLYSRAGSSPWPVCGG